MLKPSRDKKRSPVGSFHNERDWCDGCLFQFNFSMQWPSTLIVLEGIRVSLESWNTSKKHEESWLTKMAHFSSFSQFFSILCHTFKALVVISPCKSLDPRGVQSLQGWGAQSLPWTTGVLCVAIFRAPADAAAACHRVTRTLWTFSGDIWKQGPNVSISLTRPQKNARSISLGMWSTLSRHSIVFIKTQEMQLMVQISKVALALWRRKCCADDWTYALLCSIVALLSPTVSFFYFLVLYIVKPSLC